MVKKDGVILEKNLRVREDWWVFEKKLIILWLLRRKPLYLHRIKKQEELWKH